jgi:hypothetical protein
VKCHVCCLLLRLSYGKPIAEWNTTIIQMYHPQTEYFKTTQTLLIITKTILNRESGPLFFVLRGNSKAIAVKFIAHIIGVCERFTVIKIGRGNFSIGGGSVLLSRSGRPAARVADRAGLSRPILGDTVHGTVVCNCRVNH